ncbi:hypothetical protein MMC11_000948 [Xylographa trunciseda]|nr:hypothetical protein [Xylographa trunciseda]
MEHSPCTLRITGLPPGTEPEDVQKHFADRIKQLETHDLRVGAIHPHDDAHSCIVTFASPELAAKAHKLEAPSRKLSTHAGRGTLEIDRHFGLLTTLYSSNNPLTARPDVDIIVIHDLYGHPWYSFAQSLERGYGDHGHEEENWLRDLLPKLLEENSKRKVYARIMTFGYRPDLWITQPLEKIQRTEEALLSCLQAQRHSDPQRSLFLVAHGLGGVLAKQLFVDLINESMKTSESKSLLGGCIFFGVPNRINDSTTVLHRFNSAYKKNGILVEEDKKAQHIANSAREFSSIRDDYSLPILCFIETEQYNSMMVVEPESGTFNYPNRPDPYVLDDKNHATMTKISPLEHKVLEPAISFLCQSVENAFQLQSLWLANPETSNASFWRNQLDSADEDKFSILREYDTIFLVDDSSSMRTARRWELVQKILTVSTEIATYYDPDGIEIRFFNDKAASANNITDPQSAQAIIQRVTPNGRTPTLRRLSEYLRNYVHHLHDNQYSSDFSKLNLIILTDGEPDQDYEKPSEISDAEDAKQNTAANRKIRKEIVNIGTQLDQIDASEEQVGIQFCQIGNDDGVAKFFEYLDNNLGEKYNVRDMVDTVRCIDESHLTPAFYSKLLTGAIDRYEDNQAQGIGDTQVQSTQSPEPTPRLRQPHDPIQSYNEIESATRTWRASRVSTFGPTHSDPVVPMVNQFNDLDIVDENYTYASPAASTAAATARSPRVESHHHRVAAPVQDPYSIQGRPRVQTLPNKPSGSMTSSPPQKKRGIKSKFSFLRHGRDDSS